jgi:hypothetical protein
MREEEFASICSRTVCIAKRREELDVLSSSAISVFVKVQYHVT